MDCKRAEEHLSAYLDATLDPSLHAEVGEHVEACPHCKEILEDYRRFDLMLSDLPRVEPSPALEGRIFSSPQFAALIGRDTADDAQAPTAGDAEHEKQGTPALPTPIRIMPPARRRVVAASRVLLPVAALLLVVLGGVTLARSGLLLGQTAGTSTTQTIGNPGGNGIPLAAGTRLVYERDGALWSAREDGTGIAQQLTPSGVRVIGWAVSPSGGQTGASRLVYLDGNTGAVHVIRADGLSDTVVGQAAQRSLVDLAFWTTSAGQAAQAGLSWSPDGTRLAYIAATSANASTLHVVNATGVGDTTVPLNSVSLARAPLWSADSLYIAFVTTDASGAQGIWTYGVATGQAHTLASAAGTLARIAWVGGAAQPTLTWATSDTAGVSGLYAARADGSAPAKRLTPSGAHYNAADFSPASNGTLWLAADGSTLLSISATTGKVSDVGTAPAAIARIAWSPKSDAAALAGAQFVALWSPTRALATVTPGGAQIGALAWSDDGKALAYVAGDAVATAQVRDGSLSGKVSLARVAGAIALRWSPDGQRVAAATANAVYLVTHDSITATSVDAHSAVSGLLTWTTLHA